MVGRVDGGIAPTDEITRPHDEMIVHDDWTIVRYDEMIGRPEHSHRPHGEMIRHDGRCDRARVEVDATA